jgi:pentatricopeptide repeat protein
MKAFERTKQWQQSIELMQEMLALPPCAQVKAVTIHYNCAVVACSSLASPASLEYLLILLRKMFENGVPREKRTYNISMDACATGGLAESVIGLWQQMEIDGFERTTSHYNSAIDGLKLRQEWEVREKVLETVSTDIQSAVL